MSEKLKKEIAELYKSILSDKGGYKDSFTEKDFGMYLIPCFAKMLVPLDQSVCRVVQVREEIGAFGSDLVFVRCVDGTLMPWENQSFFKVKEKYIEQLNIFFADVNEWDDTDEGKALGYNYPDNKENVVGFIIPSPHGDDYISPTKAIKGAICDKLMDIVNSSDKT